MDTLEKKDFYDRYYYLTSCGVQYDDRKLWEKFFGDIADRIVNELHPKTVLDAGCAYGYLVAALRDRGVEAYGIDISDYAISQVREDIKPYCTVASIIDPLAASYDLVICIEVIEHLLPELGRKAIENLCRSTNDFIFTSTPADFKEATHFNVQPTEYWVRLFANNSFYRDLNFDASFIITHAIRFRKILADTVSVISDYEKKYFRYYQENKILREELVQSRAVIAQRFNENESPLLEEKNNIIRDKDIHINNLDRLLKEKEEYIQQKLAQEAGKQQHLDLLNNVVQEKENIIQNLRSLQQNGDKNHVHELNYLSKNNIDSILQRKEPYTYIQADEKDKIINHLKESYSNLQLENNSLNKSYEVLLAPYKASHAELQRIQQLKGYKLLWKYYKLRDNLLSRKNNYSKKSNSHNSSSNSQTDTKDHLPKPLMVETVLERERLYYSRNPIYNAEFTCNPLISVIVPVFNTPMPVLEEMILSVLYQTYPNWELHLLDASNNNEELAQKIQEYIHKDDRIFYRKIENKGISANTNIGISLSKGEFIAFLDHDDTIAPHALYEIVLRLQNDINRYDFFYSDKDMLKDDGCTVLNPLYKPEWSPEILFSANYLTHFCVIRKTLIIESGLLESAVDGAQDWDIFLKVARLTTRICHIPEKLYHWRIIPTSVANGIGAKPYALQAQLLTLQNQLKALDYKATAKFQDAQKSILQIEWQDADSMSVTFLIQHKGKNQHLDSLLEQIKQFGKQFNRVTESFVLTGQDISLKQKINAENIQIINRQSGNVYDDINQIAKNATGDIFVLLDSQIAFENTDTIRELTAWAAQKQYGAISPQINDNKNTILSAGLVINDNYILDVFQNVSANHYTIFGHTEWYRNITAVRAECFVIKTSLLKNNGFFKTEFGDYSCIEFCLRLGKEKYRHVYTPFAKVQISGLSDFNITENAQHLTNLKAKYGLQNCDPYWNPNLLPNKGVPTENKRKIDITDKKTELKSVITGWEKYSSDAFYLANEFDFSNKDFIDNATILNANGGDIDIKTVNWFVPHFDFIYYAGLYTIFRLANHLQSVQGVQNTIVTVGGSDEKEVYNKIIEAFPLLRGCKVICLTNASELKNIPYADASICSLWTTAYYLLRFQNTKRKFYFIQDFEPLFYPAGSTYGQVEATYKFGFYGIANTQGLKKIYAERYNGKAIDLKPCIDSNVFNTDNMPIKKAVKNVFFYCRPGHPRNGFELGATALKILKNKMKDKVSIYCAGSDWDPADYGLADVVVNMGRMNFEKTADLYKICDAGLVMMFTKHPSYLPFELMACGCAVVSNYNEDTTWFLKDGINCLLTEPSATRIAETIEKVLANDELRRQITVNAEKDIKANHAEWETELTSIYRFMCSPEIDKK